MVIYCKKKGHNAYLTPLKSLQIKYFLNIEILFKQTVLLLLWNSVDTDREFMNVKILLDYNGAMVAPS
ncbi:hypothetical protein BG74_02385 [Sodalis-like endosymbiont of Proechinophthirus fluctus]|nr:hypothetical protein BG74_02385 [Sodalis-like endosymbiont of Proechinophthirus fluctus]